MIEDMNENGFYYVSTIVEYMEEESDFPEFDGLIFFIYDVADNVWFSAIIKEHYHVGETLEFTGGMPLYGDKEYLGFACTYDPASGKVSNPVADVMVMGG